MSTLVSLFKYKAWINEQLFAAYQQKIAFLTAAVHRGGEWQP